ncbi:MAG: response regulator transcription factor [Sphingobacteriaceae bacterium]
MKLLFVEDEPVLVEEMESYFTSLAFICEKACTFRQAEEKINTYKYDIIILDITLPDGSGIDLINKIRKKSLETGVIILSAKDSLQDKVTGLNLGADDYLTKPFYVEELNARITAVFRRKVFNGVDEVIFNKFRIDLSSKLLFYNEDAIMLTRKEYELLLYFAANKDRVLSKSSIAEHLWGDHFDQFDNFDTLYVHVKNLRKKISAASGDDYIKSVYGMGYKFTF